MGFLDFFRKEEEEIQGYISHFSLQDWFTSLSEHEQNILEDVVGPKLTKDKILDVHTENEELGRTEQQTLGMIAEMVWKSGYRELAEKVFEKSLEADDENPKDRHFIYINWEKLLYKQRDEDPEALEKCIELCKKDIAQVDEVLPRLKKGPNGKEINIDYYSFRRLAIIYEKQGEFEKAIEICNKALEHNVFANTKMGWEGRKEKLKKKLED
ncbi:tetratricopeptide repeat protein [Candidatus Bipolaricaulota bacterium]|nr:tetratricopeptide repeat protein [Candidatus Bipolaricaulota bacterium]